MNKKIVALVITITLLALVAIAEAQPTKIYQIGYLDVTSLTAAAPLLETFRQRLRELGWVEGKNIAFEYRYGEGNPDRLPDLAAELVRRKVDVIVAVATNGGLAAKQATSTIPIVVLGGGDLVGAGIVGSLAHPGANITGISSLSPELITKRLEVLKDVVPKLTLMGVLVTERMNVGAERQIQELEPAAQFLRVKPLYLETKGEPRGLENAFERARRERVDAIVPIGSPRFFAERKRIVELAGKHRLPAIYSNRAFVDEGGLMSYGIDNHEQYRRAAVYVDKILKGAKPADLPVEQPTKFEFVINLKAAKQIGLTIPPNVLARADKVIR
jgi:putative tryptophan/tyrosine transport system substrate-binding protein